MATGPLTDLEPTSLLHLERYSEEERTRIQEALTFAKEVHAGQKRVQGGPYYTHLVATAQLLIDQFTADASTVIAGLLHDTVEDTPVTLDQVGERFGPEVRLLVDGATEWGRGDGNPPVEDKAERARRTHVKVLELMAKDPRCILVKAADRWHNLLTCEGMYRSSQRRNAQEAMDFHVPLLRERGWATQADALERLARQVIARVT